VTFTTRENDGLCVVLDIVIHGRQRRIQGREIAARQQISEPSLEQLLCILRAAEIIRSARGVNGGYSLAAPPSQITVGQVLRALSGPLLPRQIVDYPGRSDEFSVVQQVWESIHEALRQTLDTLTLDDLARRIRAEQAPTHERISVCASTTMSPS